jgi:hypothetical protein
LLNIGNQYVIITSYFLSDLDLSAATANILTLRTPNFPNFINS